MRRILVWVCAAVGIALVSLVILTVSGHGPFAHKPEVYSLLPTEVQELGEGGDPLVVYVRFPWHRAGYCSGQFTVTAQESESAVVLGQVVGSEWTNENCPGIGSDDGFASAELRLRAPLGDRSVTRSADGAEVPVLIPCDDARRAWMCPRS